MSRRGAKAAQARGRHRKKSTLRLSLHLGDSPTLVLKAVAGLVLSWAALGFFDGLLWLGALSRETTPLLLCVAVPVCVVASLSRHLVLTLALCLVSITALAREIPLLRPARPTPAHGPTLRLAHATLGGSSVERERVRDLLRETKPDLLSAVGLTAASTAVFDAAFSTWPSRAMALGPAQDRGVWARWPLRYLPGDAVLSIRVGKCDVQVAVADIPALSQLGAREARKESIAGLMNVRDSARAIWLGQLGSRPEAHDLKGLLRKRRLRDSRLGHGWLATEPAFLGPLGFATDHVLVRGWIAVRERGVWPPLGPKAHRTLVGTLELTEARCQD